MPNDCAKMNADRQAQVVDLLRGQLGDGDYRVEEITGAAHPINRGLDGQSAILHSNANDNAYFLKLLSTDTFAESKFSDICILARQAHALGLAPKLLSGIEERGALLFSYLPPPWHYGTAKAFRDSALRARAAEALKVLHGSEKLSATISIFDRIRSLIDALDRYAATAAEKQRSPYPEYFHTMCDWVQRIEDALTQSGFDTAPCKVDNSLSNFMLHPSGDIQLVDFDRACNTDPLSDIGIFGIEVYRTEADIEALIEAYSGNLHQAELARVKLYMVAAAFHLGLWGIVSQYQAPGTAVEFFKYGQNHFLRCRSLISQWDMGSLLRKI